ncbi:MAG: DUF4440 domain-containing protein [Acidocella sp.]|nr:DUF4440 domain-containing protein [Acidocella sp.]
MFQVARHLAASPQNSPIRAIGALLALALALAHPTPAGAATPNVTPQILAVMNASAQDWNRGNLAAFARSYKNSPDILFIGQTISHGYAQMLAAYRRHYPTRAVMGQLTFSHLAVQPLDNHFATVTGNYQLERTQASGGNAHGYFMLVLENTQQGWKIVRDDTTTPCRPSA